MSSPQRRTMKKGKTLLIADGDRSSRFDSLLTLMKNPSAQIEEGNEDSLESQELSDSDESSLYNALQDIESEESPDKNKPLNLTH